MNSSLLRILCPGIAALLLSACGDDEGSTEPEPEDPAEHACEHTNEAGTELSAGESEAEAPLLELSEEPYTITLIPGSAGYVRLEAPAGALLFAGTADVVTGLFGPDGNDELPAPSPNEFCADAVPEHFDLDFEDEGPYVLKLGPSGGDSVWLVYASAAGHGH